MAVKVPPVTMGRLCECGRGGRVPSNLVVCYDCLDDRRAEFWDVYARDRAAWQASEDATAAGRLWELLPVDPAAVSCGRRKDLPKKQRVHKFAELGQDVRHSGADGRPRMTRVRVCVRCGTDRQGG
jgi:hypothetical protein